MPTAGYASNINNNTFGAAYINLSNRVHNNSDVSQSLNRTARWLGGRPNKGGQSAGAMILLREL